MKWTEILPVLLSIATIIVIAVVEKHSKTVAAVTATMPIGVPLALWVVLSRNPDHQQHALMPSLTRDMLIGVVGTVAFLLAAHAAARSGWRLIPVLVVGYVAWATVLGIGFMYRRLTA